MRPVMKPMTHDGKGKICNSSRVHRGRAAIHQYWSPSDPNQDVSAEGGTYNKISIVNRFKEG